MKSTCVKTTRKLVFYSIFCTAAILTYEATAARSQDARPAASEDQRQASERLQKTFADDPQAKVPTSTLPANLVEQWDKDKDGFITKAEYDKMMASRQQQSGPRDRSDFTMLRDEGFPLNVNPEILTAEDTSIGDEDMVMGVVINGEARAYPVNYMNGPHNEVVNDVLGGRAIASTW